MDYNQTEQSDIYDDLEPVCQVPKTKAEMWKDIATFTGLALVLVFGYFFTITLAPSTETRANQLEHERALEVINEKSTEVWISDQLDSQTSKEWMVEQAIEVWNENGRIIAHYTKDDCSQVSGRCVPLKADLGGSTTKYAITNFNNLKGEIYKSEIILYIQQVPRSNQCVLLHEFAHGIIGMRHHWTRDGETAANSFVNNTCWGVGDLTPEFEFSDDDNWYLDNWIEDRQWSPPVLKLDPKDSVTTTDD